MCVQGVPMMKSISRAWTELDDSLDDIRNLFYNSFTLN
jgi:hypothetical protein